MRRSSRFHLKAATGLLAAVGFAKAALAASPAAWTARGKVVAASCAKAA